MLKILVVDDEANMRHMLSLLLGKAGYDVRTAPDGEEALKLLLAGSYDMMLCDLRMPTMTGHALLEQVVERKIDVTCIMMSAYGDLQAALECIRQGAYDYIAKPFKKDEVLLTLQKAEERERLKRENARLKEERVQAYSFENIVARSEVMEKVFETVRRVAKYKTTVLISGESGTGKELIAKALHGGSDRASGPWVPINCGAIPAALLESELFGHVKGAFTDASQDKIGLFQKAHGGTIFLDEIAELPLALQVKLLRVLQEGEVRRVGDTKDIPIDVRVVAASATSLQEMVDAKQFRQDLFYRLNVLPVHMPPLRERADDIPLLVNHFIGHHNKQLGTPVVEFAPEAMEMMVRYAWPGNVRELQNTIEMAMILASGPAVTTAELPPQFHAGGDDLRSLAADDDLSIKRGQRRLERLLITRALKRTKGNRTRAAELLELSHRALLYKIKDYELQDVE